MVFTKEEARECTRDWENSPGIPQEDKEARQE
jgi:hypothetical protein